MRHRHSSARSATMAALLAVAALLSACTGEAEPSPSPTRAETSRSSGPTPSSSPSDVDPAVAEAETEILDAYRGYWSAKVAAFSDPTRDPGPELERYAVDTAFSEVVSGVFTFRRNGIKVVGEPVLAPVVSDVVVGEGGTATIVDCVDGSDWTPIYAATGESAAQPGQASSLTTTSTAYFYVDRWTIRTSVVDHGAPC